MHDGDELRLKLGLHITGNVFDGGCDGIPGCEKGVHDDIKVFYLEVSLVQGFEWASIVEVVVEGNGKVGVCDGSDESGMFGRG